MALTFDHIHIIHTDHDAAVEFYKKILGAEELGRIERRGAPQTRLKVGGSVLIVRGIRKGESPMHPGRLPRMGADHFGYYVGEGELEPEKERIAEAGIKILQEGDVEDLRFIYIEGPDGVVVELMEAK